MAVSPVDILLFLKLVGYIAVPFVFRTKQKWGIFFSNTVITLLIGPQRSFCILFLEDVVLITTILQL